MKGFLFIHNFYKTLIALLIVQLITFYELFIIECMDFFLVGTGAALGAISRYGISIVAKKYDLQPWQTIGINVFGSFTFGSLSAKSQSINPNVMLFFGPGFCGGFTTFSGFSVDSIALLGKGLYGRAATYIILSNTLSIFSAYFGYRLFR